MLEKILRNIDHFCDLFSRFDPNSILSKLNASGIFELNDEFLRVFNLADFYYKKTWWVFNALATPAHFGYTKSFDEWIFSQKNSEEMNFNWDEIKVEWKKISLAKWQILDFWGLGKWFLVDELAVFLRTVSKHFLINGGGDIWAEGWKPDWSAWQIAIEKPFTDEVLEVIEKHTWAIATSGPTKRKWWDCHHIIDAIQKKPAKNIPQSLTVCADSVLLADVWATTLICSRQKDYENIAEKLRLEYRFFNG